MLSASPPDAADVHAADGALPAASQVSPHEFMQAVMSASAKRFTIEKQSDPVEFFTWLLNTLHLGLTGNKRKKPSIITRCLQGELQITTEAGTGVLILRMCAVGPAVLAARPLRPPASQLHGSSTCRPNGFRDDAGKAVDAAGRPLAADLVEQVPFLVLSMDLPPAPLYKDALERNIIPQVQSEVATNSSLHSSVNCGYPRRSGLMQWI